MNGGEAYIGVECRLKTIRAESVWIAVRAGHGERDVNIPRASIYGPDANHLGGVLPLGGTIILRIARAMALKKGLHGGRDAKAASYDLFADDQANGERP